MNFLLPLVEITPAHLPSSRLYREPSLCPRCATMSLHILLGGQEIVDVALQCGYWHTSQSSDANRGNLFAHQEWIESCARDTKHCHSLIRGQQQSWALLRTRVIDNVHHICIR